MPETVEDRGAEIVLIRHPIAEVLSATERVRRGAMPFTRCINRTILDHRMRRRSGETSEAA